MSSSDILPDFIASQKQSNRSLVLLHHIIVKNEKYIFEKIDEYWKTLYVGGFFEQSSIIKENIHKYHKMFLKYCHVFKEKINHDYAIEQLEKRNVDMFSELILHDNNCIEIRNEILFIKNKLEKISESNSKYHDIQKLIFKCDMVIKNSPIPAFIPILGPLNKLMWLSYGNNMKTYFDTTVTNMITGIDVYFSDFCVDLIANGVTLSIAVVDSYERVKSYKLVVDEMKTFIDHVDTLI